MSEEFSIDIDEKSIEELKKTINYDELEKRHQRFMNGIETEDDLINGIYHYKIQNDKGLDLDVVELKYYQKIIDLYNKEKEKNKELENADLTTVYMNGFYDGEKKWKDKINEKIEEYNIVLSKNQTIYSLNKMEEIRFAIRNMQELLEERN